MNVFDRLGFAVKAFALRFSGSRYGWLSRSLGSTNYDYQSAAGDGRASAIVMACTRWACRTFPEAPMQVLGRSRDGDWEAATDHPLIALIDRPNQFYSGLLLWQATLSDWLLSGNAYWVKVRSAMNRPVELWWVPSWLMEPAWPNDGSVFISHYEYRLENTVIPIPTADVVHFRDGFDPNNIRKGLSQLTSLFREVATDNEASNYTASILRNLGVPGVVISPKSEQMLSAQAKEVRDLFDERFGGDQRGSTMVMTRPTDVAPLSFNPQQMELRELRRIPEERVSAIFGTPAVVVGLGAGLDRSTYSNMAEAREAAYESMIIPTQRIFAEDIRNQLLVDFADPRQFRVGWDYTQVRVLQEDLNNLHQRAREDWAAGVITLNEARTMIGQQALPGADGDIYFVPSAGKLMEPQDFLTEPEPQPALQEAQEETVTVIEERREERGNRRQLVAGRNGTGR